VLTILGQLGVAPGQPATIDVSGATIGQPAGAA
jgi:hypothetical protein